MIVKNLNELCESYKHTLQGCIYHCFGDYSLCMIELAKKYKEILTLNTFILDPVDSTDATHTIFDQITRCPVPKKISFEKQYLLDSVKQTKHDIDSYINLVYLALKEHFIEAWDSNTPHLILCSSGFDSRILSAVLAELTDNLGRDWLGTVHFRCHQPECLSFEKVMKIERWREDEYSCFNPINIENPYNIGFKAPNGFLSYVQRMNWWSDIIPEDEEKEQIILSGSGGFTNLRRNYICNNIMSENEEKDLVLVGGFGGFTSLRHNYVRGNRKNNHYCNNILLNNYLNSFSGEHEWESQWRCQFKDVLLPFFSYKFLDIACKINPDWLKLDGITDHLEGGKLDLMREKLLSTINKELLDIQYIGHNYKWNLGEETRKKMLDKYYDSLLYYDYKVKLDETKLFTNLDSFDAKIYGFMLVYGEIYGGK